jgi:hypothetical protein
LIYQAILRVGIRTGESGTPPLLIFNGIGANLELVEPFVAALDGLETIVFDVPGVGARPRRRGPTASRRSPACPTNCWTFSVMTA